MYKVFHSSVKFAHHIFKYIFLNLSGKQFSLSINLVIIISVIYSYLFGGAAQATSHIRLIVLSDQ